MYFVKDIREEGLYSLGEMFFFKNKENAKKKFAEIIMAWFTEYDEVEAVEEDYGTIENYIEACWAEGECVDLVEFGTIKWED
jgi:hypothetical protein